MDDITALIATQRNNISLQSTLFNLIENSTYDTDHKNLQVKPQPDHCFLDSIITIYNNRQSVAITYNNKNASIIDTNTQTIGRFHGINAPSLTTHKLSAAQTIFIKIIDFTTFNADMYIPALCLIHELHSLNYSPNHIKSAITKASRSRPNPLWKTLCDITFQKPQQQPHP